MKSVMLKDPATSARQFTVWRSIGWWPFSFVAHMHVRPDTGSMHLVVCSHTTVSRCACRMPTQPLTMIHTTCTSSLQGLMKCSTLFVLRLRITSGSYVTVDRKTSVSQTCAT